MWYTTFSNKVERSKNIENRSIFACDVHKETLKELQETNHRELLPLVEQEGWKMSQWGQERDFSL